MYKRQSFDIEEKSGSFLFCELHVSDFVEEGGDCVCGAPTGDRPGLVWVEEAGRFCEAAKPEGDNFFQYFGESLEEDDYSIRGWERVIRFAGLCEYDTKGISEGGEVVSIFEERVEQSGEDFWVGSMYAFPS